MTDDDALSVFAAAAATPAAAAIMTADRVLTFAELAELVTAPARRPPFAGAAGRPPLAGSGAGAEALIALPELSTLLAVYGALADRRPLALLHARLPASEQARQREAVAAASLADDPAFVLFTSGSTASARGVVLSRAAILANAHASAARLGWHADDRWLLVLSLAHSGGLSVLTRCLVARKPIVFETGASLIHRATLASLVPTQLAALLEDPAWGPPPHLRAVLLGGAAAPPALLAAARARGVPIRTTYGLTETFGQVATAPDAHSPPVPLPGVTLLAGTDAAAPAPIHVRGPMLATRYLDGAPIAPELVTADLGYTDATGALHVTGRADDVIITGGENVHPTAVEAVLAATPGVRAALAFGVRDERWGQLVAVALAVDDVATFDLAAAAASWRAALPPHALPRRVALAAALPHGATGKLDRRAAAALPAIAVRYSR